MGGSQVAQVEEEEEGAITPRESGIAREVIASERRPHPAEGWVEVDVAGRKFKLGGSLVEEERRLIMGVIAKHPTCQASTLTSSAIVCRWTPWFDPCDRGEGNSTRRRGR